MTSQTALVPTTPAVALARLEQAAHMLAEVRRVEDAVELRQQAHAVEVYLRQQEHATQAALDATEIRLRAERKAGELLAGQVRAGGNGSNQHEQLSHAATIARIPEGVSRTQSSRWQQSAALPEQEFEQVIAEGRRAGELSTAAVVRAAREHERAVRDAGRHPGPLPEGRYAVVLADPPWRYEHWGILSRDVKNHYPTLALEDIQALGGRLAPHLADDATLFLWTPNAKLGEAMAVVGAWGFVYRTNMAWVKDRIGMGYRFRQRHELLLFATRGNPPLLPSHARPDSVLEAPRREHSRKPDEVYALLETMYPDVPRLELFARARRTGWAAWGDEVPGACSPAEPERDTA
jgi:N6-adenosine-specific RNA methylase IME4